MGKKMVEKKIPIGSNKKDILVETQMMVKINKTWINQYWNFFFANVCTSVSIYLVKLYQIFITYSIFK